MMTFSCGSTHPSMALIHLSFAGAALALAYVSYRYGKSGKKFTLFGECMMAKPEQINHDVKKDESKVVDTFEIEDLGKKTVLCRCWRSKCFPKCDGSHAKHNKETGDNVGPIIIQKRDDVSA